MKAYDENAWPDVGSTRYVSSAKFVELDWKKCKEFFKSIYHEYDKRFNNWKRLGFRGEIPTHLHEMTDVAKQSFRLLKVKYFDYIYINMITSFQTF